MRSQELIHARKCAAVNRALCELEFLCGFWSKRRLGTSEAELLRSYPTLRASDLVNAWNYVRKNRDEIERHIRENDKL
jgi:hypothetical protein